MSVEVRPLIVLCIDGAICLRVLRGKGNGGRGDRGMHIGGTCVHAA